MYKFIRCPIVRGSGPKPALLCNLCGDPVSTDKGAAVVLHDEVREQVEGGVKTAFKPIRFEGYECNGCN